MLARSEATMSRASIYYFSSLRSYSSYFFNSANFVFNIYVSSRIVHKSSACILKILVFISLSLFFRSQEALKSDFTILKFSPFGNWRVRSKNCDISVGVLLKLSLECIVSDILRIGSYKFVTEAGWFREREFQRNRLCFAWARERACYYIINIAFRNRQSRLRSRLFSLTE